MPGSEFCFYHDPESDLAEASRAGGLTVQARPSVREREGPFFPGLTDAHLRMAIGRACKATGVPHFSPHGLRRRRGSLHYKRTGSLAEVAELLGDSKRVAADHYVYTLTDYREVDPRPAYERLYAKRSPTGSPCKPSSTLSCRS